MQLPPSALSATLQLAHVDDADRLASMSRTLIEAGLGWRWTPQRIVDKIRCQNTVVLTARTEISLVGFAAMQFNADDSAHLLLLAVTPPLQRRRLGTRLLNWLDQTARTAGTATITLEVRHNNRAAQRFYRQHGYCGVRVLPGYYRNREHALRMQRVLRPPSCNPAFAQPLL